LSKALEQLEREIAKPDPHRIRIVKNDGSVLAFRNLCISRLDNIVCVSMLNEEIRAGERVLIAGNAFSGNKLFKAIAGLWPWGEGAIELPDDEPMFFMPPKPYLPTGVLRASICYPSDAAAFDTQLLANTMQLAGVGELVEQLDQQADWDKSLEREQKQRLGLVRLLLHKPKWILMQEAFDSLDPDGEVEMVSLIHKKLPQAAMLTITKQPTIQGLHKRRITLN